ncbi:MAG: hypothetical protein VCB99_06935, partial [Myxococcota bacterium]
MAGIAQLSSASTLERGGGKWLGLCGLRAVGARVPAAFCIEAGHFRELAARLELQESTTALERASEQARASLAERLRARIREASIHDPLRAEILDAYH